MRMNIYIKPQVKACVMETGDLLTGTVTGDNGTGWGGVDEEGSKDPDANSTNMWEEESSLNNKTKSTVWDSF